MVGGGLSAVNHIGLWGAEGHQTHCLLSCSGLEALPVLGTRVVGWVYILLNVFHGQCATKVHNDQLW